MDVQLTELDYVVFVNKLYRRITRRRAAAPSSSLDLAAVARLAIDRALDDDGGAGGEAKAAGGGGGGVGQASRLASYASGVRVLAAAAARVF